MGQDIDFDNARPAHGLTMNLQATLQPTPHLAINFLQNTRSLHVDVFNQRDRLFVERVPRVNSTYMFTSGIFVRIIGQYVSATRDQVL